MLADFGHVRGRRAVCGGARVGRSALDTVQKEDPRPIVTTQRGDHGCDTEQLEIGKEGKLKLDS